MPCLPPPPPHPRGLLYIDRCIISSGKRSIFQEHNEYRQEASNISNHSLNRSKKNQAGHTAAEVCQGIQAVNKFC